MEICKRHSDEGASGRLMAVALEGWAFQFLGVEYSSAEEYDERLTDNQGAQWSLRRIYARKTTPTTLPNMKSLESQSTTGTSQYGCLRFDSYSVTQSK